MVFSRSVGFMWFSHFCAGEEDEDHQRCDRTEVQDVRERGSDSPRGGPAGGLHHSGAAHGQAADADQPGSETLFCFDKEMQRKADPLATIFVM